MGTGRVRIGACVAAWLISHGAEAKMISYEINGQRYAYSTNDRRQMRLARQRIEAANAADAAQAQVEAERVANPLVRIFGSQAQREAAEAQKRLQQVMTQAPAAPTLRRGSRAGEHPKVSARRGGPNVSHPEPSTQAVAAERDTKASNGTAPAAAEASVTSVYYDLSSGIRTVHRSDGSVHEAPIDGTMFSKPLLDPADESLMRFVEAVRKPPAR